MYTSEDFHRTARAYFLLAVFCAGFAAVYESFSFGVYSIYMMGAFLLPLAGGALPFRLLEQRAARQRPVGTEGFPAYHAGIATLTVGSIVRGILDIYGTTNRLLVVYGIAGALLIGAGCLRYERSLRPH